MAESLGEAVLTIRTDDGTFTTDVSRSRGASEQLGTSMDKTRGSSAQLAGEMQRAGRSAEETGKSWVRASSAAGQARLNASLLTEASQRVTVSAGQQRQGLQQLSFQLNDVATMYSLGARPMQIFASQSGQVIQAIQLMTGGASKLGAFLGGPWGIALTSAVIVLIPFISKLFEAETALESVELASDNLGDAQDSLRKVIDTTTGALDRQKVAAIELERVKTRLAILDGRGAILSARGELSGPANERRNIRGPFGLPVLTRGGLAQVPTETANILRGVLSGQSTTEQATRQLGRLRESGAISEEQEVRLSRGIVNLNQVQNNLDRDRARLRFLDGEDTEADRELLGIGDLIDKPKTPRAPRQSRARQGRTQADRDEDFAQETLSVERETLQARLALANDAQSRADIQNELLNLERQARITEIEATDLSRVRKDALIASVEAVLGTAAKIDEQGNLILSGNRGLEGEIIARDLAVRQLQQAQLLAQEKFQADIEALQNAGELADTERAQKDIALRLYDLSVQRERIRLQEVIDAEAIGAATKEEADLARQRLATLDENEATGREVIRRRNETRVEGFVRGVNQTPEQINQALEDIQIDGLLELNDGLGDAIRGVRSLGDVFSDVADQIIADILRIAIRQAIIRPLAGALFGGIAGGGPADLLAGIGTFAGGFATGGLIPNGQFGIVGENGPELAFATPRGVDIVSNADSRRMLDNPGGGGTSVTIPISIDATGADAAAIARLNSQLQQLQQSLPGTIVSVVQDASERRILRGS